MAIHSGKKIYIPEGTYLINVENNNHAIALKSNQKLIIDGVLKLKPNKLSVYQIIKVVDAENVVITGKGSIIGDKDNHTTGEYCHGVLLDNVKNVLIENISITKCFADGIAISGKNTPNDNNDSITINNVKSNDNGRLGLSIIGGKNIKISNSQFNHNIGQNPQAGIDIEPNIDIPVDVFIDNVECIGNGLNSLDIVNNQSSNFNVVVGSVKSKGTTPQIKTSKPSNIIIDNLVVDSDMAYGIAISTSDDSDVVINSLKLKLNYDENLNYPIIYSDGTKALIKNCYVSGVTPNIVAGNNAKIKLLIDKLYMDNSTYGYTMHSQSKLIINEIISSELVLKPTSDFAIPNFRNKIIFSDELLQTKNANIGNNDKQYNGRTLEFYNNSTMLQRFGIPDGTTAIITNDGLVSSISLNPNGYCKIKFNKTTNKWYVLEHINYT